MPDDPGTLSSNTCDLLGEVNRIAYRQCVPLNVSCEITLRCNIRCVHCYNFDRDAPCPGTEELTFEEWKRVLEDLREAGTLFVSLTGGEPLAHPRFFDLLRETARLRFAVQILANGTLLTPETVDRLASHPNILSVGISLYGAGAETHDAVTRTPGSFREAVQGALRLRDAGLHAMLKFIVLRRGRPEVGAMIELSRKLGLPYLVDTCVTPRYDGGAGPLDARVTIGELEELYRGPLRHLLCARPEDPGEDDWSCSCARGTCAVTATGDVYPCIAVPWKAGNVRERPFAEIWRASPVFERIRGLRLSDYTECRPCPLKRWCRRNNGTAYLHAGEYTAIDPWTCREAEVIRAVSESAG